MRADPLAKRDRGTLPVKVGDQIDVTVERLGYRGEGVARHEGVAVFVEGVLPGERAAVRIVRVARSHAFAKALRIVDAASDRVAAPCPVFGLCGGCQVQHLSYEAQLRFKRQVVTDALQRIGKFDPALLDRLVKPVIGQTDPWRYRNKVSVMAKAREGRFVAGFVEEGTHEPVEQEECLIRPAVYDGVLRTLVRLLEELAIAPYDEGDETGSVAEIVIRDARAGDVMVVLKTATPLLAGGEELARRLSREMPAGHRLASVVEQAAVRSGSGSGHGRMAAVRQALRQERLIWGSPYILDAVGEARELQMQVSASSFLQVNPVQADTLYRQALAMAAIGSDDVVFDLYSGIGTLSLLAARSARAVYGVESVPAATADAAANARRNHVDNVHFVTGRAERVVPLLIEGGIRPNVVLLDPPRSGCEADVLLALAAAQVARVVYVSCNPATLARDLRLLADHGYVLGEVAPVDMFPQTAHVEVISSMFLDKSRGYRLQRD
ncbi:MAG: 23S rRNA (uracil(1939)-C(5))-methyltransferase RlmD [Bacilli bacterium]